MEEVAHDFLFAFSPRSYLSGYFQMTYYEPNGDFHHCGFYTDEFIDTSLGPGDPAFLAGKAFAMVAMIFLVFASALFIPAMLCSYKYRYRFWISLQLLISFAFLMEAMSFVIYGAALCEQSSNAESVNGCSPDGAGIIQIINVVILCFLLLSLIFIPPPQHPVFRPWASSGGVSPSVATKEQQRTAVHHRDEETGAATDRIQR